LPAQVGAVGGLIVGLTSVGSGALIFGHVEFAVTASIAIGSVPAVLIGSYLSSRADKVIRPIITSVIFASGTGRD
jgi:uncharacterized membrane protein YfcA